MKRLTILLMLLMISSQAFGMTTEESDKLYFERQERYRRQVQGEINRAHALQIEATKIEVLGRLQMLSAPQINVSTHVSSGSVSSVQNTNRNSNSNSPSFSNQFTGSVSNDNTNTNTVTGTVNN